MPLTYAVCPVINTFTATNELSHQCASSGATDEYTHHSVHVTQPYTGTTADDQLTPRQNQVTPDLRMAPRKNMAWQRTC